MRYRTLRFIKLKIILAILFILATVMLSGCFRPKPTALVGQAIDVYQEPVQNKANRADAMTINALPHFNGALEPQAMYKIAAVVAGKKMYHFGWTAKIAPIDLALIWGKLPDLQDKRYISYSQGNRWYFFRYSPESPVDGNYIASHSANNHIIPANMNILRVIRSLAVGETVLLEGYLVNLTGKMNGQPVWWNSSLTRTDTGDGACELFYVYRIQIGDSVYQ